MYLCVCVFLYVRAYVFALVCLFGASSVVKPKCLPAATFRWAAQAPLINTSPHVLQILCATSNPQVSAKIYNPFQYLEATEGFGEGRNNDFGCFYTARQAFNYLTRLVYTCDCLAIWPQFYQFQHEEHREPFEYILEMSATLFYTFIYEIMKKIWPCDCEKLHL